MPGSPLVQATVRRFARQHDPAAPGTAIRWSSSIPRDVGLAGSSALVIAVLRALCERCDLELEPARLAALALAVEVEDLGIVAGPQDRVAQAHGGLTFTDFADGRPTEASGPGRWACEQLAPALLPPLLIAWRPESGGHSGAIHSALRRRHLAGEPLVVETMGRLAAAAREARTALLEGDPERFGRSMDATLDLRRGMIVLDPRCLEMVEVARARGVSANYTGSGGAIVAACPDRDRLGAAELALRRIGCQTRDVLVHIGFGHERREHR
jgi:glucuronokinase